MQILRMLRFISHIWFSLKFTDSHIGLMFYGDQITLLNLPCEDFSRARLTPRASSTISAAGCGRSGG